jgi:hypothetical protein
MNGQEAMQTQAAEAIIAMAKTLQDISIELVKIREVLIGLPLSLGPLFAADRR